jgi:hypothetical protein
VFVLRSTPTAIDYSGSPLRIRCPNCGDRATLDNLGQDLEFSTDEARVTFGQRRCPQCDAHIFVAHQDGVVLRSYPAETIDFDSSGIPATVREPFDEAIKCHASECFVASAIMVRKTLEMLCMEHEAEGNNLKERIEALGQRIVLPKALLDGLDELRLLGNDAAHVESRMYDEIGKEEVEVAIDVAKEILKATYQLDSIVDRLRALKRPAESG